MKRFRGGLVFKVHRRLCHSTLGSRVTKKKKVGGHTSSPPWSVSGFGFRVYGLWFMAYC